MAETAPLPPHSSSSNSINTDQYINPNTITPEQVSGNPFVQGLMGPISDAQGSVGPGEFEQGNDPTQMLEGSAQAMGQILQTGVQAGSQLIGSFAGVAAQALGQFAGMAGQALTSMMGRSTQMGATVGQASESTSRATSELAAIAQSFAAISSALEPNLIWPGVAGALAAEAQRHAMMATEVVTQLEGELSGHAAEMTGPMMADIAQPAAPAAGGGGSSMMSGVSSGIQAGTSALSGIGQGFTQAVSAVTGAVGQVPQALTGMMGKGGSGALGHGGLAGAGGMGSAVAANALRNPFGGSGGSYSSAAGSSGMSSGMGSAAHMAKPLLDPRTMGKGVQLFLPDGSTSQAPNAAAANAVRHALSQVGVPYEWGGTKPGVGLDCSGLTQWAYQESGLNLPRLAQEQGVGLRIDPGSVMPGDLAVWDGHVAMVIGNGMMVEAGDPVQISPIRTTNAGQGFHGFFRPTGS